jgi:hypothetical protein
MQPCTRGQRFPVPSGPNSVPTTGPDPPPRSTPSPPRERGRSTGRTSSGTPSRPNWSAFHPRAPPPTPAGTPERDTDHGRRAALDPHPPTREA